MYKALCQALEDGGQEGTLKHFEILKNTENENQQEREFFNLSKVFLSAFKNHFGSLQVPVIINNRHHFQMEQFKKGEVKHFSQGHTAVQIQTGRLLLQAATWFSV